ncbi:MAG: c-type cytochrome [Bacteroidetes bacterium]|nr:c-type cytochrome [Bacteroidota bacterium]
MLFIVATAFKTFKPNKVEFQIPDGWPKPHFDFKKSPLTKEGIYLGRKLFYDAILSVNNTISCASCHLSYTAFTHVDHALSHGVYDSIGTRNSLAILNVAWSNSFMWDGAINHIEVQALAPINHPLEMGEELPNVVQKLQNEREYPRLFNAAFGDSTITGQNLLKALAQFQLTFVSSNAKYDKVVRGEDAFTEQEERGYKLFKAHCNSCHKEPLFTKNQFANNGLPIDSTLNDVGRMGISLNAEDSLKFKIPTLRNIEFSFPYMHDGRFRKLSEVLNHYQKGIVQSPTLAKELRNGIALTSNEKVDLIAFLLTLSDKEFLFNQELAFPR